MIVASQKTEELARQIWLNNNLNDKINWEPEMWNDDEFSPVWGSVEFEGWTFSTNENSDWVHFWSPENEEGDFLRD